MDSFLLLLFFESGGFVVDEKRPRNPVQTLALGPPHYLQLSRQMSRFSRGFSNLPR